MRMFIALEPGMEAAEALEGTIRDLKDSCHGVKWVEPANLHVTLKFLGEVPDTDVKEVERVVKECVKVFRPFRLEVKGLGFFGSERRPKVIWAGLGGGSGTVKELMVSLDSALSGFRVNEHPPSAHVTLGRVKPGSFTGKLMEKVKEMKDVKFGETNVKLVKMKKSVLGRQGPLYGNVGEAPLKAGE